jgi:hypothetical protein
MYSVYVIVDSAGRRYVGQTDDLQTRLARHNSGMSRLTTPTLDGRWRQDQPMMVQPAAANPSLPKNVFLDPEHQTAQFV